MDLDWCNERHLLTGKSSYVGTLHEINSESSTVALENVTSFGTEGRKQNPDDEIAGLDSVYEYIVFRGSDVKDLRIEEAPKENKPPQPPQPPNDPAILVCTFIPLAVHKPLNTISLMKHCGCKNLSQSEKAQNPAETFRCLPSEPTRITHLRS